MLFKDKAESFLCPAVSVQPGDWYGRCGCPCVNICWIWNNPKDLFSLSIVLLRPPRLVYTYLQSAFHDADLNINVKKRTLNLWFLVVIVYLRG